jgi:hypothetical protein
MMICIHRYVKIDHHLYLPSHQYLNVKSVYLVTTLHATDTVICMYVQYNPILKFVGQTAIIC